MNILSLTTTKVSNKDQKKYKRFTKIANKAIVMFKDVAKKENNRIYIWDNPIPRVGKS